MRIAQVRKSPDVAQADTVADARKDEVHFPRPLLSYGCVRWYD